MSQTGGPDDVGPENDPSVSEPRDISTPRARQRARDQRRHGGGGDDGGTGTLELRMGHVERRLEGVEAILTEVRKELSGIASKAEIRTLALTVLGLTLALMALLVTAMGWLETRAARLSPAPSAMATTPQPIVIQIPASPAPSPPPAVSGH